MSRRPTALLTTLAMVSSVAVLTAGTASPAAGADSETGRPDKIHSAVLDEMEQAGTADRVEALVVLAARPQLSSLQDRTTEVTSALESTAAASQAPVVDAVRGGGGRVLSSFWLQNMVLVEATPATLEELTAFAAVDRIIPNFPVELPPTPEEEAGGTTQAEESTWGIERIGADTVHSELGVTGDGVRVAVLDTGVDISHPDLAGKLVTDDADDPSHPGGWIEFDETGQPVPSTPHDSSFHGTHVAGTAVGGEASGVQIGVAPGAELMAALVIPGGSGTFTQVIAGMQWALAPTDADGNPAGEPADVVNLSLGGCGLVQEMVEPTRNLRAAGVFPAFSIGNNDPFNCPSCGPADSASPGNVFEAVGVGATDPNDDVDDRSCGGVIDKSDWANPPANWPERYVKPDVSAPGVDVLSAQPGGGYQQLSGTSMAAPHVAGTAALLFEARADIGVDAALQTLAGTSFFDDRHGAERPNPRFGWGRIDAYEAVQEAALRSGITGVITDAETDEPIAGARVTRADNGRSAETDADGRYEMRLPAGTYTVQISHFGYETLAVADVVVGEDELTTLDPELVPAARGSISGTVIYEPTGSTVPGATVRVLDVPVDLSGTTTRKGEYTISGIPEGSYRVAATTPDRSGSESVEVTVSAGAGAQVDLVALRPPATERVSLSSDGRQGNGGSQWPSISADGRYVAFGSLSNNLVDGDTNNEWDIYLHDRLTGLLERVSVAHDGGEPDGFSLVPRLSTDGRHVGFNSNASNLVDGNTNGLTDTFVRDLAEGITERVSVASDSGNPDGNSGTPSLSADGRYAAFGSDATNLVAGDTNGAHDVFVRDRHTGSTVRVSVGHDGSEADRQSRDPSISADGRYVAFHSDATNLVEGDTNGRTDVFVHDRDTGETVRVTGPGAGSTRNPSISADGHAVAFAHPPTGTFGLSQVYVHDLDTGVTEPVSVSYDGAAMANLSVSAPALSHDGSLVTSYSGASNLVEGDTNGRNDIFVRDRRAGTTERVSRGVDGAEADDSSALPVVSPDGRYVAFQSTATNLVGDDGNGQPDVFVHDTDPERPEARFAVWGLEVRQPVVRPGRPVVVMARVKNIGDRAGEYDAVLRVDGQVEDTVTVDLKPDAWSWVKFKISRSEPGTYDVAVGPTAGQFTVRSG